MSYKSFTLKEVWVDKSAFIEGLKNRVGGLANWDEFINNPDYSIVLEKSYEFIDRSYNGVYALSRNMSLWKEEFINKFIQVFPAYLNKLKGDLSIPISINKIGDFEFKGSQPTELKTDAFDTPNQTSSYTFKQKSDNGLRLALNARTQDFDRFVKIFSPFFCSFDKNISSYEAGVFEQVAINKENIEILQEELADTKSELDGISAQVDLNTNSIQLQTNELVRISNDVAINQSKITVLEEKVNFINEKLENEVPFKNYDFKSFKNNVVFPANNPYNVNSKKIYTNIRLDANAIDAIIKIKLVYAQGAVRYRRLFEIQGSSNTYFPIIGRDDLNIISNLDLSVGNDPDYIRGMVTINFIHSIVETTLEEVGVIILNKLGTEKLVIDLDEPAIT